MFLLYYKNGCTFSKKAENLLSLYNLNYIKIVIPDDSNIRSSLLSTPYYHRTMPAIFFYQNVISDDNIKMVNLCIPEGGLFIGGYDKLNNLISKILSLRKENIKQIYQEYKIVDGRLSYVEFLIIAKYVVGIVRKKSKDAII